MLDKSKKRKIRACRDEIRASEILWSIISDIRNDFYEKEDFEMSKSKILDILYEISIKEYERYTKEEQLIETLIAKLGDNIELYIPPESNLVKKLRKLEEKEP